MSPERRPPDASRPEAPGTLPSESSSSDGEVHPGQSLDHFRITVLLGRGGMGAVFLAEDTLLQRPVAIKVLPRPAAASDADVARLLREAQAVARIDHPHIVRIHHVGQWAGGHYLVLELMPGGDLQSRLRGGPLPWPDATRATADACRGLAAAHAAGFLHRDVKPSNLMIDAAGRVRLADFGLVRGGDLTASTLNHLVGTPHYMSPEQCRGEPVDARSDLYALGATYFALLTGRPPYSGDTPMQVMFAHCSRPVPEPGPADAGIPAECLAIVRKAMAKEPMDRFQSAGEMLAALAVLVDEQGLETTDVSSIPPTPRKQSRSRRLVQGLVGLVLLAGLVGGAAIIWPPSDQTSGQRDNTLHDAPTLTESWSFQLGGKVRTVTFSPDGKLFAAGVAEPAAGAAGHPDGAVVWELPARTELARLWDGQDVLCLAFDAHKRGLGRGCRRGAIAWNLDTQMEEHATVGYGSIPALAWAPDGTRSAGGFGGDGSNPGHIDEWLQPGGRNNRKLGDGQGWPGVAHLTYHADLTLAAAYQNGDVRLWHPNQTGPPTKTIASPDGSRAAIAFAPDRPILAIAAGGEVRFWAHGDQKWTGVPFSTTGAVSAAAFSADGRYLMTAGPGKEIILWDSATGKSAYRLQGHRATVLSLARSPDGRTLASGDEVGQVRLWDLQRTPAAVIESKP